MTPEEAAPIFAARLEGVAPLFERQEQWPAAQLRLRLFVGDFDWPPVLATSARAVVFKGSRVVVVRQTDGERHIRPGGRLEPGETVEQAARREVLEETGWELGDLKPLGFQHFHHLGEKPASFRYRWCDFIQPIFVAEGVAYRRGMRDLGQLEVGARLTPIGRAMAEVGPCDVALLPAALARRTSSPSAVGPQAPLGSPRSTQRFRGVRRGRQSSASSAPSPRPPR
jgi:8-oxo-dGTP pyrophosphatase MutT (NUDIX family)